MTPLGTIGRVSLVGLLVAGLMVASAHGQDDYERAPIHYATATPDNVVSRLQQSLATGETTLDREDHFGYLRDVLAALEIPVESQVLVFSKTSLQRHRISPKAPRSLYFNDDVTIGFCQRGDVLEVSAVDPTLGTVFYTLDQTEEPPEFVRQTDECLLCHGSTQTMGVPGHLLRSVFVDAGGQPVLSMGTKRVNHTTPFAERWAGWYVTGEHGKQTHRGNLVLRNGPVRNPDEIDNTAGQNVTDLSGFFKTSQLLTPHSDLVALMVMEHQTYVQNLLVQANFTARQALHHETMLNAELHEPAGHRWDSTTTRLRSTAESLLEGLLLVKEAPLAEPIRGTSGFAEVYARTGARDPQGRSLRELDLTHRLYRYPCSPLIMSAAFRELPDEVRQLVWRRLTEVLLAETPESKFTHLSAEDRRAIREILAATHPDCPEALRVVTP
jgi:hypothetical protein